MAKLNLEARIKAIATDVKNEVLVLEKDAQNVVVPFLVNVEDAIKGTVDPTSTEAEQLFLTGVKYASQIAEISGNAAAVNAVAETIANVINGLKAVSK